MDRSNGGSRRAGVVEELEAPTWARESVRLPRVDYADFFRVDARRVGAHSGEDWAREILEGASPATRASLRQGWRALGLRLVPLDAEGAVLGWPLLHSGEDFALLGLESRTAMAARLLAKPEGETFLFGTFIYYGGPAMKAVWAPIAAPHRRIVTRLLASAERRWPRATAESLRAG